MLVNGGPGMVQAQNQRDRGGGGAHGSDHTGVLYLLYLSVYIAPLAE